MIKTNLNPEVNRAMQAGDYAIAAACFDRLGKTARSDEQLVNAAAFTHLQLGNDDRALEYLTASLKIRAAQADVNEALGDIYLRRSDQDNSLKHLRRAVALAQKNNAVAFRIGKSREKQQRLDEAIALYKEVEVNSNHAAPVC